MLSADLDNKGKHALTYGISLASPTYGTGFRLAALGIDTSRRPYITLDDGAATHNCIKFGTGNDISMYFDATNLIMAGASERVGKFTLDNIELNIGEFASAAQGSGVPISSTYSAAFRAYADDNATKSTSGSVGDVAVGKFRYLSTVLNENDLRRWGVMGQVKAYDADWDNEQVAGVYGYLEMVKGATNTMVFDGHGVSSAVCGVVETAGNMEIGTNHILAGFSAVSKLSYSGTLTMTGNSAAYHCGIYDSTNWSDSPSLDMWKYGMMIETGSAANGILIGNSTTGLTLASNAAHGIEMYTTCASTSGSNSIESLYSKTVMTGAAGVGGRARFHLYTQVALGGWCNALKAHMEFGNTGKVTGMASALCAELALDAGITSGGHYAPLESELTCTQTGGVGAGTSFLFCNVGGHATGITTLNTSGYLFELGENIVDTASGMIDSASITATNFSHRIRIRALGVDMWIGVHTDPDFTT